MTATRITVLISGSGTNLQALINATGSSVLPDSQIVRVVSNKKDAFGLQRAEKASIPTAYHNLVAGGYTKKYPNTQQPGSKGASTEAREAYDADLAELVLRDAPDLIVCAGWMHVLSSTFLNSCVAAGVPVINLHPALPGEYNGAGAIQRAFADFQAGKIKRTGIMIHYVIQEVDMGQAIVTEEVPMFEGDTEQRLEERIHETEHRLIVRGTRIAVEDLERRKSGSSSVV